MKLAALLISALLVQPGGKAFLEPLFQRDSVLVGDQFLYGFALDSIPEDTPILLPEMKPGTDSPFEVIRGWQLDRVKVSGRKEVPARYNIKASIVVSAFEQGIYTLSDLTVLVGGDTLVFKAPAEPLFVKEPGIDMETFQAHDIKPQQKFPLTFREVFPWLYGGIVTLLALSALILWLVTRRKRKSEEDRSLEPPHIRALRKLDKLRGDKYWKAEQQKTFYSGVTDALREYIAARFGVGAMEMTTAEIFEGLKGADIPEDLFLEMKGLFETADFVKFAKFTASDEDNAKVLPSAVRFVTTTYQSQLEEEGKEE